MTGSPGAAPREAVVATRSARQTRRLGERLAALLRPGDLLLLAGPLGAGKTTLTQGIAAGLGVAGPVTSPTFVLAREHRPTGDGPGLVHVDAYRLRGGDGSPPGRDAIEDLDLDTALGDAVVVVEWGEGLGGTLAEDHLEVLLTRPTGAPPAPRGGDGPAGGDPGEAEPRTATLRGHGPRWAGADLSVLSD